jgi:lipid II:glycine glycyltransferase (peptidoglycan interpeptide bridge formation enzyme)
VYAAFVDGRPAAAIVVLLGGTVACMWRGAMDEALAGPTYANYLLHRTAIEDAAEAGCSAYHMGDSAPGSPLALFKSRFGAVEHHYASYRLERIPIGSLADRARRRVSLALRRTRGQG